MFAIKRIDKELPLPFYQTRYSAGMDLYASKSARIEPGGDRVLVKTGIAIAIPAEYEAQVRPRSGLAQKNGVTVLNAPGTIDADYRGEIGVILVNHGDKPFEINRGDRIAQLVIAPIKRVDWTEVDELVDTERGDGGFGSTGGYINV